MGNWKCPSSGAFTLPGSSHNWQMKWLTIIRILIKTHAKNVDLIWKV